MENIYQIIAREILHPTVSQILLPISLKSAKREKTIWWGAISNFKYLSLYKILILCVTLTAKNSECLEFIRDAWVGYSLLIWESIISIFVYHLTYYSVYWSLQVSTPCDIDIWLPSQKCPINQYSGVMQLEIARGTQSLKCSGTFHKIVEQ